MRQSLSGFAARLTAAAMLAPEDAERALHREGLALETQIKANASGRPGPRVVTGNYRRSWSTRTSRGGTLATTIVGTNAPQARRLEFGFTGSDALGRVHRQAPLPHVQPAVDKQRVGLAGRVVGAMRLLT